MLELAALLLSLMKPPHLAMPALAAMPKAASFQPAERAVDNWRMQAALDLDLGAETALRWLAGSSPANLPRCIRLNNYWCIKKAGWAGEIAADPDGHVAFASAQEGAVVAVLLLRRYYLEYGRKSARAIVARWAPAQCGLSVAVSGAGQRVGPQGQQAAAALTGLTKYGIGNTLRARWLAAHARGGSLTARQRRNRTVKRSVVPDRLASLVPPAGIVVALGNPEPPLQLEPPLKAEKLRVASAGAPAPVSRSLSPAALPLDAVAPLSPPGASCTADTARLANYATRAIEGVAGSVDEELKLFDPAGRPLPALPRVLANMAGVEIGPYRADAKLIEAAIEAVRKEGSRQ